MNTSSRPDILLTSPKTLNTDTDQYEERVFLNGGTSKKRLFTSRVSYLKKSHQSSQKNTNILQHRNIEIQLNGETLNQMPSTFGNSMHRTSLKSNQFSAPSTMRENNLTQFENPKELLGNPQVFMESPRIRNGDIRVQFGDQRNDSKEIPKQFFRKLSKEQVILRSANQIMNINNQKILNKGIQQRKGSLTGWNWGILKKRIDALKYLMRNIEMSGMIQNASKLKMEHINIIEDQGSDFTMDKKQSKLEEQLNIDKFLSKFSLFFLKIFKDFPTVSNSSMLVVLFKIILAFQLLYQIFQLPLMVSFPNNSLNIFSSNHPIFRFWFAIPFILEIALNFNISYYEHGEQITSKLFIIARYLKKDFWWDLTGVIGSGFIFQDADLIFIFSIFILRFMKFKIMYDTIEEKFQLSLRFSVTYTLLNLFLSITAIAHVCGCIFQYIAIVLNNEGINTWLDAQNLLDSPISDRYIAALYFSYITMISVGYGDIVPISNQERIFVIFMTMFSCGVFAYVVSSIGELFTSYYMKQAVFKYSKLSFFSFQQQGRGIQIKSQKISIHHIIANSLNIN